MISSFFKETQHNRFWVQVAKSYSAALKQSTNFEGGNDECNEPKEIPSIDGSPKEELPTESVPKTEADDPSPFVCDVCSRAFKTKRGLKSHQVCPLTQFFLFPLCKKSGQGQDQDNQETNYTNLQFFGMVDSSGITE